MSIPLIIICARIRTYIQFFYKKYCHKNKYMYNRESVPEKPRCITPKKLRKKCEKVIDTHIYGVILYQSTCRETGSDIT